MNGAIKFGWRTMKQHFWLLLALIILTMLVNTIPGVLAGLVGERIPMLGILIGLAAAIFSIIIDLGILKIALKLCDGEDAELADVLSCVPQGAPFILGSILYGLIVSVGFLLFIIPGIIWGIKFQYFAYAIIDKKLGPVEALKESSRITTGAKWDIFLFGLLLGLLNFLGALCFGVGLLATVPTSMVAYAFVYRSLSDPEFAETNELARIPTPASLKWLAVILFLLPVLLGILAAILVPNFLTAIQRSKVSGTRADMRAIGTALGAYQVDYTHYPVSETGTTYPNEILPEAYYAGSFTDGWGNNFYYISEDGTSYRVISYGKDGEDGATSSRFDADIVYSNGEFIVPED